MLRGKCPVLNDCISLKFDMQLAWCHAQIPAARRLLSTRQFSVVCRRARVPSCAVGLLRGFTHFSSRPTLQRQFFAYSAPLRGNCYLYAEIRMCRNDEQLHCERAQKNGDRPGSRTCRFFFNWQKSLKPPCEKLGCKNNSVGKNFISSLVSTTLKESR